MAVLSGGLAAPAWAITNPSAPAPSTSVAGATGVAYTIGFNSPSSLQSPDTITLNAPAGTFVAGTQFDVRHGTNTFISSNSSITNGGATATLTLFNPAAAATPPGDRLTITVTNATNTSAGTYSWSIATSKEPTPVATPTYTLTAPQTITNPSAPAPSTTVAGVTGVTYTVGFNASSTGQLVNPQTITLNAPAGTFVAATQFDVRHGTNTFISSTPTITNGGATVSLRLFNPVPTPPSERFTITITNATNTSVGNYNWTIATTSDPAPVTTPSYTLTGPQTITSPSAPAPSTTASGVGGVSYTVGFNASSTGQLVNPQAITLNAPPGTFTATTQFDVRHGTNNTFISSTPTITNGGATVSLRLFNATPTPPSERFTIRITDARNAAVGTYTWTIATTSDPAPITTPSYTLTTPQTITNPSATPSTTAPGVGGVSYTVGFNASSTGQLVNPQAITLNAPPGTFTATTQFDVRHGTNNTFISSTPTITNGGATVSLRLFNAIPTPPSERFTITVTNATNAAAGSHTWTIATTSDPAPVNTQSYSLGGPPPDTTPPDTTIASGPSGPTNDSTPTFTFSSEAGSTFECRVDTGTFAPCTSPHTTTALAPGPHTFEVRATDAAGNQGTAATRSFTVTAPPPADTTPPDTTITSGPSGPTPDPTPTFAFSSSEPGSTFQCSIDGGPFVACSSPFTTPPLPAGAHTFRVRAVDAAGNVDTSPAGTFGTSAAERSFNVQAALEKPVIAKNVNVEPVKGEVLVSVPAGSARAAGKARASATVPGIKGRQFVPLSQARQIPVGSLLDTRKGTVRLTSARNRAGATQSSTFASGVFQVLQSRSALTELRLKGSSFRTCGRASGKGSSVRSAARRGSKRRIRRLRGNGSGRFRTRGRYSAATVRGTDWTVTDRCDGTLTQVKRGRVAVRDFRRRKNVTVKAGKSYLARARR